MYTTRQRARFFLSAPKAAMMSQQRRENSSTHIVIFHKIIFTRKRLRRMFDGQRVKIAATMHRARIVEVIVPGKGQRK